MYLLVGVALYFGFKNGKMTDTARKKTKICIIILGFLALLINHVSFWLVFGLSVIGLVDLVNVFLFFGSVAYIILKNEKLKKTASKRTKKLILIWLFLTVLVKSVKIWLS